MKQANETNIKKATQRMGNERIQRMGNVRALHVFRRYSKSPKLFPCAFRFLNFWIGDWGEIIDAGDPNREIGFGFVSCSCRACERAGEAKLCGRVREQCFPTLGLRMATFPPGRGFFFCVFVAIYMGFKAFSHGLLLCSWAF